MKKLISVFGSVALAGCCSYSELSRDVPAYAAVDGDEKPMASYVVVNVSYSLFGLLPLSSGETWKSGPYADRDLWNVSWFKDGCTLDENVRSVRAALRECKSDRICNLVSSANEDSAWSLFLVNRKLLRTSCLILAPKAP